MAKNSAHSAAVLSQGVVPEGWAYPDFLHFWPFFRLSFKNKYNLLLWKMSVSTKQTKRNIPLGFKATKKQKDEL